MNKSGFSLFEIMITCLLILLIISYTFVYKQNIDQFIVQTHLNTLYMICMTLSHKAQLTKHPLTLTFNKEKNSYSYEDKIEILTPYCCFGYPPGTKGPPSAPHNLVTSSSTFSDNKIIFYEDGTIKSGTIYITNASKTVLFALSSPIAQISYLRRYRYLSDKWVILP